MIELNTKKDSDNLQIYSISKDIIVVAAQIDNTGRSFRIDKHELINEITKHKFLTK